MRSFFLFLFAASISVFSQPTNILLEPGILHIGQKVVATFPEGNRAPIAPRFNRIFESQGNSLQDWTLRVKQQHVVDDWGIEINGQPIARLNITSSDRVSHFSIPAGSLSEGVNKLSIIPRGLTNDILVGQVEIIPQ